MEQILKIKAQVSSIWAKGRILMTVCVLSDLTRLPLLGVGRKSWYIMISHNELYNTIYSMVSLPSQYHLRVVCSYRELIWSKKICTQLYDLKFHIGCNEC